MGVIFPISTKGGNRRKGVSGGIRAQLTICRNFRIIKWGIESRRIEILDIRKELDIENKPLSAGW